MKALMKLLGAGFVGISLVVAVAVVKSPIDPQVWIPPANPGFVDGFAVSSELSDVVLIDVPGHGPEDVSCATDGSWVTGLEDGRIITLDASGVVKTKGNTSGRPVGLQAMADGSVILADAMRGLLRLNPGRVHRLWLKGDLRGENDIFIDRLPAMVDNISFNGSDTFWVASPNPREALDALADKALFRRILGGLPVWVIQGMKTPFSMVSAFDLDGQLITSLRDPSARLNQVTSVNECNGNLILGSLVSSGVGLVKLDNHE